jgi:hypothetical protein
MFTARATLALAIFLVVSAFARYSYVKHGSVLARAGKWTAILPANPRRAYAFCVISHPRRDEPFAPSYVTMGNTTAAVPVGYPDREPWLWANTGRAWVVSDQDALISCTELVRQDAPPVEPR